MSRWNGRAIYAVSHADEGPRAIHAYFFITTSWRHSRGDDGTGHGAGFLLLADAINNHGDYSITVYHTFHDEVDSYRTHVWLCDGPCRHQPPFFGLVKRSMNRPPGKSDSWWQRHQEQCGGKYAKIAEPEMTKERLKAMSAKERAGMQKNKLDAWVVSGPKSASQSTQDSPAEASERLINEQKRKRSSSFDDREGCDEPLKQVLLACPICDAGVTEGDINEHLDKEHS